MAVELAWRVLRMATELRLPASETLVVELLDLLGGGPRGSAFTAHRREEKGLTVREGEHQFGVVRVSAADALVRAWSKHCAPKGTTTAPSAILKAFFRLCLRNGDVQRALDTLGDLFRSGIRPDAFWYNKVRNVFSLSLSQRGISAWVILSDASLNG